MKKNIILVEIFAAVALLLLWGNSQNKNEREMVMEKTQNEFAEAYFSGGCFWCVEAVYESVKGVHEAISGYAGGTTKDPTYELVGSGETDHAETVKVLYDPSVISFKKLVEVFFGSHDPTTLNRQGPDTGTQYRSIAFYRNKEEKQVITQYIDSLTNGHIYDRPIVTEVLPLGLFYRAEEYHQNYEKNNPNSSYIRFVSMPRLNQFKKNNQDLLKDNEKEH